MVAGNDGCYDTHGSRGIGILPMIPHTISKKKGRGFPRPPEPYQPMVLTSQHQRLLNL
jgi:hypothetical protein